jgi:glycine/D-amino acid oxidase-like deaminating enzyme/nitrite reductase/ring-hydroxylating ferredoxin subunit
LSNLTFSDLQNPIASIHETCNCDHFKWRVFINMSSTLAVASPCGVTAHGSPSGPLQFDRLGSYPGRQVRIRNWVQIISDLRRLLRALSQGRFPIMTKTASSLRSKNKTAKRLSSQRSTTSLWIATSSRIRSPVLDKNTHADVCVVGAGIAGMTSAYLLAREGKSVVVVDKNAIARGETAYTTAHLSSEIDASYRRIVHLHGAKGAQLAAQSHTAAISEIESIITREKIDCDFERLDGYLFLAHGDSEKTLVEEFEATQSARLDVIRLDGPPFDLKLGPCLRFPRQAQFHPLKYMAGLAQAFKRLGGRLYAKTEAQEIEGGKSAKIKTQNGITITADAVVVATNTPVNDWVKMHTKQAAYRTYVIGVRVPADSIPKALYWDTEDPFHYVRLQRMADRAKVHDLLIIGGEDHKTGQDEDIENRFARLTAWGRKHFPGVKEPQFQWSGQVVESVDGLAFIGRNPGDKLNVYIATGDSGAGLTHGTIAGVLLRDLILGRDNPWTTLYDPARKSLPAALNFAKENLNVAGQYAAWVTPGDVGTPEKIKPGMGAVIRMRISKIAVYRDDAGKLYERSAVCPHLGCIVSWNSSEGSWDCPCHGSRFEPDGKVLNGPAIVPLEKVPHDSSQ